MIVVVDASVALKWFFKERADESDTVTATEILFGIHDDRVRMVQPPHFLSEVASVLVRENPEAAHRSLERLARINWETAESMRIYSFAMELSVRLDHHLFDTLYHATSLLTEDATLITADEQYYRKAYRQGCVSRLADFDFSTTPSEYPRN